jgi:hypothetical protein
MLPPLVKMATSAMPGEAKFVALAGAGLSKDAGLPTAWDLMLATAALLRTGEDDDGTNLQTWFLNSPYKDMKYSELIGGLFSTSAEQQAFIRERLRADKPGRAHALLAELARLKVIRCVITTNFDDLIERALTEAGLDVQVIANIEDLKHSEPLIHCKRFRVYKPHGTIGVGRLRNTPADLEKLSRSMESELVRVIRDHGLIVLGYSGQDESILRVFRGRRQHLYPTFWINPSAPPDTIPPLFGVEGGTFTHVPCTGASAVLTDLLGVYKKLAAIAPASGLPAEIVAVRDAVRGHRPDAAPAVRSFMASFINELKAAAPDFSQPGEHDEFLIQALERTKPLCAEFVSVAAAIAEMDNRPAATALYKGFGEILSLYRLDPSVGGSYRDYYFDYYKFLGHELFVTFFAMLIREERWETVADLLGQGIFVANAAAYRADVMQFDEISQYIWLFEHRSSRLGLNRTSLHADILKERHSEGDLAKLIPLGQFMESDYFLALRSVAQGGDDPFNYWHPWSVLYMPPSGPRFILEAKARKYAERLLGPLGVKDIDGLRRVVGKLTDHLPHLFRGGLWFAPLSRFDLGEIGSR